MSELEDIEYSWYNPDFSVDALFWPGINILFFPSSFNVFEMSLLVATRIDKQEDKVNCIRTTPPSERQNESPCWLRSILFGTRTETFPDYNYRKLFEWIIKWRLWFSKFVQMKPFIVLKQLLKTKDKNVRQKQLPILSFVLLVAALFSKNQDHLEEQFGQHNGFKIESPCQNWWRN